MTYYKPELRHFFTKNLILIFVIALAGSAEAQQKSPRQVATNVSGKAAGRVSADPDKRPRLIAEIGPGELSRELDERPVRTKAVEPDETPKPTRREVAASPEVAKLEKRVFELINRYRESKGLERLHWSEDMAKVARLHSSDMATYKFFSHASLDGSMVNDRADDMGFSRWKAIGENIAFNKGYDNPAEFACERWQMSPSHLQNIVNPRWKETGVGVAITEDGRYYFTQVFLVK